MIIFGPLLVVLVIFFPRGITGSFLTWMHRKSQHPAPEKARADNTIASTQTREAENNA